MPALKTAPPAIPATAYARSWANTWTDPDNGLLTEADLERLAHVNCSYLSSHRPPTLLALKQHAQSLAVLIQRLCVSDGRGILDDAGVAASIPADGRAPPFQQHDAFDWLNDLGMPYKNDDESHHLPIRALMNTIAQESERDGPEAHCPLHTIHEDGDGDDAAHPEGKGNDDDDDDDDEDDDDGGRLWGRRPFATHANLVMHANACLELLDHEFSATGGLMSVLPSAYEGDAAQLDAARNTLLGQWLLHHQSLIRRLHELEISYTNALAVVDDSIGPVAPRHADMGDDGGGAGIPVPQDELLIVGNRSVVYERIHALLDRAEAQVEKKQALWWDLGVSGEATWMRERGGEWYARGLVPIDLETRFFRIKGQGRKGTLFMMPGIRQNAALDHLLDMERRPTVVSVVTPRWAERATALEVAMRKRRRSVAKGKEPAGGGGGRRRRGFEDGDVTVDDDDDGNEGVKMLKDMLEVKDQQLERVTTALAFYERNMDMDAREQVEDLLHTLNEYKQRVKELERQLPRSVDVLGNSDFEM